MLVVVHAIREEDERHAYARLLDWMRARGTDLSFIVWDQGRNILDLTEYGIVREVEAINRWRLPQWLERVGLRGATRRLRHARMRWWWARAGRPDSTLVLGVLRPELFHYVPPGTPVGALVGWRAPEGAESYEATVGLSQVVVTTDAEVAEHLEQLAPGKVVLVPDLIAHCECPRLWDAPSAAALPLALDEGTMVVAGLGPLDWRGAPDLFLRAAGRLARDAEDLDLRFVWFGRPGHQTHAYPYRFDADRLGVADVLSWLAPPDDYSSVLPQVDVLVLVGRVPSPINLDRFSWVFDPRRSDPLDLLRLIEVPIVGFGLAAVAATAGELGARVPFPDTDALAAQIEAVLREPPRLCVDRTLDLLAGKAAHP